MWIHPRSEDVDNERMHLLTLMAVAKPGWIARTFALSPLLQSVSISLLVLLLYDVIQTDTGWLHSMLKEAHAKGTLVIPR